MSDKKEQKKPGRVRYSQAFKDDAVNLVLELGSLKKAAERLGVTAQSLNTWVKKAEASKYSNNDERVAALEAELKQVRKERDEYKKATEVLKKASAFFLQDPNK